MRLGVSEAECSRIFDKLDCDGNGTVSYSEWLCALVYCDPHIFKANLPNLFKFLDVKKQGKMTIKDLEHAYKPHIFRLKLEPGREEYEL